MPLPAPAIMSAATGAGMGSAFLTGASSAFGSALGSAFGGTTGRGKRRDQRQAYRYQKRFLPGIEAAIQSKKFKRHMKDVDAAGLHRLAALGIAPSSGSASAVGAIQPEMPGQHVAGSAIETGINTMIGMQKSERQTAHQQIMGGLQIEEQTLRNDWLKTQILNSEAKRLASMANSQRPNAMQRLGLSINPHPSEAESRVYMHPDGSTYKAGGGTPASILEDDIGEWADWMPQTLGRAYDVMKAQSQYAVGIDPKNTFYDKYLNRPKRKSTTRGHPRATTPYKSRYPSHHYR